MHSSGQFKTLPIAKHNHNIRPAAEVQFKTRLMENERKGKEFLVIYMEDILSAFTQIPVRLVTFF